MTLTRRGYFYYYYATANWIDRSATLNEGVKIKQQITLTIQGLVHLRFIVGCVIPCCIKTIFLPNLSSLEKKVKHVSTCWERLQVRVDWSIWDQYPKIKQHRYISILFIFSIYFEIHNAYCFIIMYLINGVAYGQILNSISINIQYHKIKKY